MSFRFLSSRIHLSLIGPISNEQNSGSGRYVQASAKCSMPARLHSNGGTDAWADYQFYDDAFFTGGHQSVKFGFAAERMQLNVFTPSTFGGQFLFGSLTDFLTNVPSQFNSAIPGTVTPRNLARLSWAAMFRTTGAGHPASLSISVSRGRGAPLTTGLRWASMKDWPARCNSSRPSHGARASTIPQPVSRQMPLEIRSRSCLQSKDRPGPVRLQHGEGSCSECGLGYSHRPGPSQHLACKDFLRQECLHSCPDATRHPESRRILSACRSSRKRQ